MAKIFITAAGLLTAGFGIWHFFVPKMWRWYSYIDKAAGELVLAVRAINIFFSLSLVILGAMSIAFVWHSPLEAFALKLTVGACALMWLVRTALQAVYPQGTMSPWLQYGMLAAFICIFLLYAASLMIILKGA